MAQYPLGFGRRFQALGYALAKPREIAIVGDPEGADTQALLDVVRQGYRHFQVLALGGAAIPLLVDQSIIRHISVQEIREAFANSQVIEDYQDDKYGPSCLVLGFTLAGRPLHILCSHPSRPLVKIVTLYEPDPDLWIDFRARRT